MIDRHALLNDLQGLLRRLEADLLERSTSDEVPEVGQWLRAEYAKAKDAERIAQTQTQWIDDFITQVAAAWVLSCVFARFLEDNTLVEPPRIAGPGARLERARDEHTLFFQNPERARLTDREYLLDVFSGLARLPVAKDVFGPNNPMNALPNWLGPDAAGELLGFFQRIEADTGNLVHDFTDFYWDTRFLGDLYQDLSEAARKKYALLQTPEFVEEFILDRTLEPALDEFGLVVRDRSEETTDERQLTTDNLFKMIDPACGSGHFLLGAFRRIEARWGNTDPNAKCRDVIQRTLDSIHGVDLNPFAVAIARFRLLLAALKACGVLKLANSPAFHVNVVCGDSLYHGRQRQQMLGDDWTEEAHYFATEDAPELRRILREGMYHCVVANPPYIVPKDRAANQAYRKLYSSCHMKYSLAVPFMERIFRLAIRGGANGQGAGYTGQITSNSFMKREFGKKLIEQFLPTVDLTHVIDTSGAYIPGHGTPTVILFGRNRKPITSAIRAVMGIRGEPSTPDVPSRGLVWSAIVEQIDQPGSQSEFVSVGDPERKRFEKHPWSIGGGGAAELKEQLEGTNSPQLSSVVEEIGVLGMTNADEVMLAPEDAFRRFHVEPNVVRKLALGDEVRDRNITNPDSVLFPYQDERLTDIGELPGMMQWLWPTRTILGNRATFARLTYFQEGRPWWAWHQITLHRLRTPLSIVYAEVATHNHFVLDRGGKVFKQTAPVIKLPADATENDHLALLGLLNSSTACFWMKQVCHQKQMMGGDGIRIESKSKVPYAFNGTALGKLPIPEMWKQGELRERLVSMTRRMDELTQQYMALAATPEFFNGDLSARAIRQRWADAQQERQEMRSQQIFLQEEIDFTVYRMFDLVTNDLLASELAVNSMSFSEGNRPFCIVQGVNEDGFEVPAAVPTQWPEDLQELWQRRIDAVRASRDLRLVESSFCKRRWIGRQGVFNHQRSNNELNDAAERWLLDRLERYFDFDGRMREVVSRQSSVGTGEDADDQQLKTDDTPPPLADIQMVSIARLADVAGGDERFMEAGSVYRNDPAFNVQNLVEELVAAESVPLLPVLRYKPSGLRKREQWEETWELQRREDELGRQLEEVESQSSVVSGQLEEVESEDERRALLRQKKHLTAEYEQLTTANDQLTTSIPVPPKYKSSDFISSGGAKYWKLRGKLDVPKERWISFPHCQGEDGTLMICWAGYDHLQQAKAISAHYVDIQERLGGRDDPRLIPLLACLIELIPWLKQWHNGVDLEFGMAMGDYFEGFITEEARGLGKTIDEIKAWQPPPRSGRRRRRTGGG